MCLNGLSLKEAMDAFSGFDFSMFFILYRQVCITYSRGAGGLFIPIRCKQFSATSFYVSTSRFRLRGYRNPSSQQERNELLGAFSPTNTLATHEPVSHG